MFFARAMRLPTVLAWIHPEKQRYYQAHVYTDRLGDLIVRQTWGRLTSRQGGGKSHICVNEQEAEQYLAKLQKRRYYRGYIKTEA